MLPVARQRSRSKPDTIKHMLMQAGLIPNDELRLPLVPPSEDTKALIKTTLKEYGVI